MSSLHSCQIYPNEWIFSDDRVPQKEDKKTVRENTSDQFQSLIFIRKLKHDQLKIRVITKNLNPLLNNKRW